MSLRPVKLASDRMFRLKLTISHVEFHCRIADNVTRATVEIELVSRGVSLDYRSVEETVKTLARAHQWTAEELAIAIAEHLAETINNNAKRPRDTLYTVKVRISFQETGDTHVVVEAEAP